MIYRNNAYILKIICPDTTGIVAAVSGYLSEQQSFIEESTHFGDRDTGRFFMRTRFTPASGSPSGPEFMDNFSGNFAAIAKQFEMDWELFDTTVLPRVLVMVSSHEHCLNDLLYRYRTGMLHMEIPAIVSNHPDFSELAKWHGIPFFHIPVSPESKKQSENRLLEIMDDTRTDLIVLARYMQVLSDKLCEQLPGKIINIHHSFLPGFKGARPYHMAYERGVKLIGATAHYVTPELDEGPIIEQTVERVDHKHSPAELAAVGKDVESLTLARAVKLHIDHRICLNGKKTVVLR